VELEFCLAHLSVVIRLLPAGRTTTRLLRVRPQMPVKEPTILSQLFMRHGHDLLQFLARRVGAQDAPDLLQETFLRLLRRTGEPILEPSGFLRITAVNLARDHRRRRKTELKYLEFGDFPENLPASYPLPEEKIDAERRLRRLHEAIKQLPPRCRQVFIMRRFEELPQKEIAKRLGISRNMVQQHLRLVLKRCRAAVE
jgi:RNA polymerase sigma factor (sigma-70 family)